MTHPSLSTRLAATLACAAAACTLDVAAQPAAPLLPPAPGQAPAPPDDRLFQALGGREGLRALMEDFVDRLRVDARTRPFFENADRERLVGQLTDQLCYESGGPCVYRGAPMGPVHRGLEITRQDFNALVEVLQQAMDARGIAFPAQNRLLARLAPMHRVIVTR